MTLTLDFQDPISNSCIWGMGGSNLFQTFPKMNDKIKRLMQKYVNGNMGKIEVYMYIIHQRRGGPRKLCSQLDLVFQLQNCYC